MKKELFKINTKLSPKGDQEKAIKKLSNNIISDKKYQVLLGATGTGKTFTIANVIKKVKKPTLILAHNKTLVNQLYKEIKLLFPHNRVEYFISYFDYYRPEAYIPSSDTYVEKTSARNANLELLRLSTINSLTHALDQGVIVVASVASIYGVRQPDEFKKHTILIKRDSEFNRMSFIERLIRIGYERNNFTDEVGSFKVKGDIIEISIPNEYSFESEGTFIRIDTFDNNIESIEEFDIIDRTFIKSHNSFLITAANMQVISENILKNAIPNIEEELEERIKYFQKQGLLIEAQRIKDRVNFDLEQLREFGITSGMENYSLHLEQWRKSGEPTSTLFDYFPKDFLLVIDESHITLPQIKGMFKGDRARKQTLVDYGFRLPSALDNRPLKYHEFEEKINQAIFVSATPAELERGYSGSNIIEQIIRPTGLVDPQIEIRNPEGQISNILEELRKLKKKNQRAFIVALTKKSSEQISSFLSEQDVNVAYMHSELATEEREEVLRKLRIGIFDAIVGINLLREGLDIPEVSTVMILDANKEGFLRNSSSLIQLIGRASRNIDGKVIMYSELITKSMKQAIDETERRRELQLKYNKKNNITPQTIKKAIEKKELTSKAERILINSKNQDKKKRIDEIKKAMRKSAKEMDFETAIELRDILIELNNKLK